MFFTISKEPDPRFPHHDQFGAWWFSHDNGWSTMTDVWGKGYRGNYLLIKLENNIVTFEHPTIRSFPLWWDDQTLTLTNLLGTGKPIYADKKILLFNDWLITEDVDIHGSIATEPLDYEIGVKSIVKTLRDKSDHSIKYLSERSVLRFFVTGGIDTITLLSLFKAGVTGVGIDDLTFVDYEMFMYDDFTNRNIGDIRQRHWGYKQIHHWGGDTTTLISGASGDEYMMRGPNTIALWCAWHDVDFLNILQKSQGYHRDYYLRPKNAEIFKSAYNRRDEIRDQCPQYSDLIRKILDINANDHQHWHLGNTLTWTPFLDPDLTKIVLRLPFDNLMAQFLDAQINRDIIDQLYPDCAKLLSSSKNKNSRENLHLLKEIINK